MLAWELGIPDDHGMTEERYAQLLEQELELEEGSEIPVLLPENDRAYRVLIRLFSLTERGPAGALQLNYQLLRDIMIDRRCTRLDREKILDAWSAIRRHDADQRRDDAAADDWKKKEREWFGKD